MPLEGIPEGVEVVRYGTTDHPDEWSLHDGKLRPSSGALGCLVVKPASGYEFKFDIVNNRFSVVRLDAPLRDLRATFHFTNLAVAEDVIGKLRLLPGLVDIWEIHEGRKTSRAGEA